MLVISNELEIKIKQTLVDQGMELYYIDQEVIGNDIHLIVFIQKNNFNDLINLDDCVNITRAISEYIDDYIDETYVLEVSSPGTNRTLFTNEHLQAAQGQYVDVRLKSQVDGIAGKKHIGILNEVNDNGIVVDEFTIESKKIKKIMYVGESND